MNVRISRRPFLRNATVLGLTAASWSRVLGANDRLRLAAIGTGGKGWSDLTSTAAAPNTEVAALCDVDESMPHLGQAAMKYPAAAKYTDWRRVLDDQKNFDAVIVSTPDHMHAPISLPAMQLGKHVQCQKPLTHTVNEARQMKLAAAKYNVVTQMGNQIQSHEAYRTAVRIVHDGLIGKVREVHSWQAGDSQWRVGLDRPAGSAPVPAALHWDEWLGVAPTRPYLPRIYHSFNWRNWLDFSNGQLGDFGCHILDPVFMALKLTAPLTIAAEAPPMNAEVWPLSSTVRYRFPATALTEGELSLTWRDGVNHYPPREPLPSPTDYKLPGSGSLLIGSKGVLLIPHVAAPKLFPEEAFRSVAIPKQPSRDHYVSWANACRGADTCTSPFDYAGPLTEAVLLGTIATRLPGVPLHWNAESFELTGSPKARAMLSKPYRAGWEPKWI